MATVNKIERTVKELVGVTLHLDVNEAKALRDVLFHVGGNELETRRGYAKGVLDALNREIGHAGDEYYLNGGCVPDMDGEIYFREEQDRGA